MGIRYVPDTVLLRTTPGGTLYHPRNGGREWLRYLLKVTQLECRRARMRKSVCLTTELRYELLRSVLLLEQNMLLGLGSGRAGLN